MLLWLLRPKHKNGKTRLASSSSPSWLYVLSKLLNCSVPFLHLNPSNLESLTSAHLIQKGPKGRKPCFKREATQRDGSAPDIDGGNLFEALCPVPRVLCSALEFSLPVSEQSPFRNSNLPTSPWGLGPTPGFVRPRDESACRQIQWARYAQLMP